MEVRKYLYLIFLIIFTSACSQKTAQTVSPELYGKIGGPNCNQSTIIHGNYIVQWENGSTTIEKDSDLENFKTEFIEKNLDQIKHIEFNKKIFLKNDQKVTLASGENWGQQIVEAANVWNQGVLGAGVAVGVVDASVDYSHPQLSGRLLANHSERNGQAGRDDDNNGYIDDEYGWDFVYNRANPRPVQGTGNDHGSHVAGIIAADHNFGFTQGIAPAANIVPANFIGNDGGDIGTAILAINYVARRGARIINASWGGPGCSQALSNTIQSLSNQVLFVVASGNSGLDLDRTTDYPASFNHINQITIAATRATDFITTWSNTSFSFVHLAAPGENILSSVPGGYAYMSGTSMAAPFVSGAAALLWSAKPQATVSQIKLALLSGVDSDPSKSYRVSTGGRLNLRKSLDRIRQLVP